VVVVSLKARGFHLVVAGLFLGSLGASGICEARCLELALGAETPHHSSAGPSRAAPESCCHGTAPAQRADRAESLDPTASGSEPACYCVHADHALLQKRADAGRQGDVSPALALAPRAVFAGAAVQRRHVAPSSVVTLAPHQDRNQPLLI
jgi:hypothetical protein